MEDMDIGKPYLSYFKQSKDESGLPFRAPRNLSERSTSLHQIRKPMQEDSDTVDEQLLRQFEETDWWWINEIAWVT